MGNLPGCEWQFSKLNVLLTNCICQSPNTAPAHKGKGGNAFPLTALTLSRNCNRFNPGEVMETNCAFSRDPAELEKKGSVTFVLKRK
jgi:hypothetical protein